MISLQKERFSSLNSSTVAVNFCDVIVRPARSGRDLAYTMYRAYLICLHCIRLIHVANNDVAMVTIFSDSLWRRSQRKVTTHNSHNA